MESCKAWYKTLAAVCSCARVPIPTRTQNGLRFCFRNPSPIKLEFIVIITKIIFGPTEKETGSIFMLTGFSAARAQWTATITARLACVCSFSKWRQVADKPAHKFPRQFAVGNNTPTDLPANRAKRRLGPLVLFTDMLQHCCGVRAISLVTFCNLEVAILS